MLENYFCLLFIVHLFIYLFIYCLFGWLVGWLFGWLLRFFHLPGESIHRSAETKRLSEPIPFRRLVTFSGGGGFQEEPVGHLDGTSWIFIWLGSNIP